jgi:hypothetical protein
MVDLRASELRPHRREDYITDLKTRAGHVWRQMLTRYNNIRTEAKRNALEDLLQRRQTDRDQRANN